MRKRKIRRTYDNLRPEYKEAIEDARLGRNLIGPFKTVEEAFASMLDDDTDCVQTNPAHDQSPRLLPVGGAVSLGLTEEGIRGAADRTAK